MGSKGCIKVKIIQCPSCKDIIYSRARYDWHTCTCGKYSIDGGFDYVHFSFPNKVKCPEIKTKYINATRGELYRDWNYKRDKFGIIKE